MLGPDGRTDSINRDVSANNDDDSTIESYVLRGFYVAEMHTVVNPSKGADCKPFFADVELMQHVLRHNLPVYILFAQRRLVLVNLLGMIQ